MPNERLTYLFFRYFEKTASKEELDELMLLLDRPENADAVKLLMEEAYRNFEPKRNIFNDAQSETLFTNIQATQTTFKRRFMWWRAVAAALVLSIFAGWWMLDRQSPATTASRLQKNDVLPGSNKAVLSLADGSIVTLDSTGNQVIQQGNTTISQRNGQLLYASGNANAATVSYNTLTTPRGGQFQITLPDGSKVWLNAASSLRFPTAFTGSERRVEMTGEVYFEITKNARKPFRVTVNDMTVEVLGTHFNVKAYTDEKTIATTLLEGSVQLTKGTEKVAIKPGEQAQWASGGKTFTIGHPELDQVMAWKNGYFRFDGENIVDIMKQLSRWYDVDAVYAGNMTMKDYSAYISRNSNISEVLKMLELTEEVSFKIEGKKVTVTAR
jgi:ferric-dicitrate binding protein FerR (iron transport regulator)